MAKGESLNEKEQLGLYKQALTDILYIIRKYSKDYPAEAWETIRRIASDPKLRRRSKRVSSQEIVNG